MQNFEMKRSNRISFIKNPKGNNFGARRSIDFQDLDSNTHKNEFNLTGPTFDHRISVN